VTATADYQSLHRLSPAQALAVAALASGQTQEEAAEAAGVHRVSVTRWANHHPAFRAELNRLRAEAAAEVRARVVRVTTLAVDVVEQALSAGSEDAAFRWLRLVPVTTASAVPAAPTESSDVVEGVRQSMRDRLSAMLMADSERTTEEAERLILDQLAQGPEGPKSGQV
jgi:hypothetical protein